MNNISLIPIQNSDILLLLDLARSTFINSYAHLNDPKSFNDYVTANFNLTKITTEFNHPESAFFFAKKDREICGYLKLNWEAAQTDYPVKNGVEIERIYVLQAFQGQKIGKLMVEETIQFSKSKNLEWLWLGVWERNPKAIGFYEKMGFEAFGEHVFVLGEEQQTDVLMRQKIGE
ncbi:MAG: ribosomal protein S18 acetylase RimI-like enzyme [Saprospiraceae bacterium]|jgi:ribosomal protein S18 acetylase RimI-like enzyme